MDAAPDAQYCPFCEQWGTFLPHGVESAIFEQTCVVGGGRRPRARCPACGSTDRERLIYLYLSSLTRFELHGRYVLQIAPERNLRRLLKRLIPRGLLAADITFKFGIALRMDVMHVPLRDRTFDFVICCHVLEHVRDDGAAMREIARVLKPGGLAILQVPVAVAREYTDEDTGPMSEPDRAARFGQQDHLRLYGRDYPDRLRRAGFDVECVRCSAIASAETIRDYGLAHNETLYIGRPRSAA